MWDANQARQFKATYEKQHKEMWKHWKKAADNKPHKVPTPHTRQPLLLQSLWALKQGGV